MKSPLAKLLKERIKNLLQKVKVHTKSNFNFLISDFAFYILLFTFLSGCGGSNECPHPKVLATTPAIDPATAGIITGKVLFEGKVPPPEKIDMGGSTECKGLHPETAYQETILVHNGALQNVFVYIKSGLEKYKFKTATEPVKVDQYKCEFVPRVIGIQTHQPIIFLNSDPTLHNIQSSPKNSEPWNIGLASSGSEGKVYVCTPEVMIPIRCDLHNWMIGFIGVVDNPYFAVTGANGTFQFKNVPPGEYTIEVWHESLGTQTQKIKLSAKETKVITFTYKSK